MSIDYTRERLEHEALKGYEDDLPGSTAKARLDAFVELRNRTAGELVALVEVQRRKLQATVDAPGVVNAKRNGLLKTLARKLLGGEEIDHDEQKALDSEVASAKRKAAVAQVAIAELDEKIDIAQLRCKRLREREHGFVQNALLEHVAVELGPKYKAAVDELRRVTQQIDAVRRAGDMVGLSITIPENRRQRVDHFFELPGFGILKGADAIIAPDSAAIAPWREMIKSWTQ
jgi:hypothetical protein